MFKKVLKLSKDALSNENGGPNLENLIGIGVSLGVTVALYNLATAIYSWINTVSDTMLKYTL